MSEVLKDELVNFLKNDVLYLIYVQDWAFDKQKAELKKLYIKSKVDSILERIENEK